MYYVCISLTCTISMFVIAVCQFSINEYYYYLCPRRFTDVTASDACLCSVVVFITMGYIGRFPSTVFAAQCAHNRPDGQNVRPDNRERTWQTSWGRSLSGVAITVLVGLYVAPAWNMERRLGHR